MDEKNNGGPAFPQPCAENGWASNNEYGQAGGGLSLRDYFAAKAMQAYVTQELIRCKSGQSVDSAIAEMAYEVADAMLAERNK